MTKIKTTIIKMKKTAYLFLIALLTLALTTKAQSVFVCTDGTISFFSETPLENIEAMTHGANCVFNTGTGEIIVTVLMKSFRFDKPLMEEHFNEKYVESDKYPKGIFKGKFEAPLDASKDSSFSLKVNGTINIHGVEQKKEYTASVNIKNGIPSITGSFMVSLKDHNIEVPTVVFEKIAEEIKVTCNFIFKPYQNTKAKGQP